MSTPESSRLRAQYVPANADAPSEALHPHDPHGFIATLDRIGKGAAADGQPWPERHQMPGRRMALEMLLAAERVRQNGPEEEYVGDRVMEGLMMASLSLAAQASARMRPEG
ncbi:hypothetical protein I5U65_01095 [Stenotrophomonas maltophilia]|nr:hypothetical protein [Stenotrophomonas maltophilia]